MWLFTVLNGSKQKQPFEWFTIYDTNKNVQNWSSWFYVCEPDVHVNNQCLQEQRATSWNREVIVQLVSLQLLFIRGVKAGGDCLSAATGPLRHVDDCNEQKVALADNCQWTRVSQLTSIISLAAQFTPLCPFSLPLFLGFLSLFFFHNLFITLQLQLICNGKLGPSTSLSLCLGRARVSWVRGQKEEEERKKQRESWK